MTLVPGKYRADLSRGVKAGIASAIQQTETSGLRSTAFQIPAALLSRYQADINLDQANSDVRNALETGLEHAVVAPLIDLLEPVFGSDGSDESSDRQLAAYTQEIVDRLLDEANESLPVAVADILLKEDHNLFEQIVDDLVDVDLLLPS